MNKQTSLKLTMKFDVPPQLIFSHWLQSEGHGKMTGASAEINDIEGAEFSAWDGYITGKNIRVVTPSLIIQSWRTTEFDDQDPDSLLRLQFVGHVEETILTLLHTQLPAGTDKKYHDGWMEFYYKPMQELFNRS